LNVRYWPKADTQVAPRMSAFDPKRTLDRPLTSLV
jgi:hypothetical protein